jgi:hypothetical protein
MAVLRSDRINLYCAVTRDAKGADSDSVDLQVYIPTAPTVAFAVAAVPCCTPFMGPSAGCLVSSLYSEWRKCAC